MTTNGSIQPRCAAADEQVAAASAGAPGPDVRIRNRKTTNSTNRATRRSSRYRIDALASGGRPSQASPSTAPPRARRGPPARRAGRRPAPARRRAGRPGRPRQAEPAGGRIGVVARRRLRLGSGSASALDRRRARRRRVVVVGPSSSPARRRRLVVVVVGRLVVASSSPSPAGSTGRPTAPQVATVGSARWIVERMPRRWRQTRMQQRRDDEQQRHDLGGRDPEERPVVLRAGLEDEADDAVPDEEDEQQVARPQPVAGSGSRARRGTSAPSSPGHRLVQEQRMEAGSTRGKRRAARVGARSDGRSRSGCPTAASSAGRTAPG